MRGSAESLDLNGMALQPPALLLVHQMEEMQQKNSFYGRKWMSQKKVDGLKYKF